MEAFCQSGVKVCFARREDRAWGGDRHSEENFADSPGFSGKFFQMKISPL